MSKYHIGLDFGTYQTKACIYDNALKKRLFFVFPNGTNFIPSRVALRIDELFEYGYEESGLAVHEFSYFKMASADDDEFRIETFGVNANSIYNESDFKGFTPEFLSVVYLTYILLTIKEHYRKVPKQKVSKGMFGLKKGGGENAAEIVFSIKMGIPTEWSQKKNWRRKRKFETILLISECLQQKFISLDKFKSASKNLLLESIHEIYIDNLAKWNKNFDEVLNDYRLTVYPENAAGLKFITAENQLPTGYYAAMDIGGGSTDISFFRVEKEIRKIYYLASESYLLGANNFYVEYGKTNNTCNGISLIEKDLRSKLISNEGPDLSDLRIPLNQFHYKLEKLIAKLYMKRVYWYHKGQMNQSYNGQDLILYGGGLNLALKSDKEVCINNNGVRSFLTSATSIYKVPINNFRINIDSIADISMLVVAYGLSYVSHNDNDWISDKEYNNYDLGSNKKSSYTQHPYNEGMFIYNVLNRRFW